MTSAVMSTSLVCQQLRISVPVPRQIAATSRSFSASASPFPSSKKSSTCVKPWQGKLVRGAAVVFAAVSDEVEEEVTLIEEDAMERMEKSLETVRSNFNTVRTGRATPSLLDRVEVDYYGASVTLKSIAQIATQDGSTLLITPFDKSSLGAIEKALMKSDVGLTPNSDGNVIRLSVPQLTADRRKELLKIVSRLTEDGKVALRNVRRDAIKSYEKLEKEKKISKDNAKDLADGIQKMTDDYVKQIDTLYKSKEKDLNTI